MTTLWNDMTGPWQPAILFMLAVHLLVAGGLIMRRPTNRDANLMLGLLLITLAGIGLRQVFLLSGLFELSAGWAFLPIANDLALAPLILGYVFLLTSGKLPLPRRLIFAPAIAYILYMTTVLVLPESVRRGWLEGPHTQIAIPIMTAISLPATIIATWLCWRRSVRYRSWLLENSSAKADFEVRGLNLALLIIAAPVAGWVLTSARTLAGSPSSPEVEYPFYLLLALCGYVLALTGLYQPNIEFPRMPVDARGWAVSPAPGEEDDPPAAPRSPTPSSRERHETQALTIRERIVTEGWHTEPRLALGDVAMRCGLSDTAVSQALNQGLGVNFNRFINEIRIDEVKAALEAGTGDILGLALDTGFNSKATFNRVFKEITGQTPSAYRARAIGRSEH